MLGILFDTSVYIAALRRADASPVAARRAARAAGDVTEPLWLSTVVLEELYAGAFDQKAKKMCARLERDFDKAGRLLVPNASDWSLTGQVLAQLGSKYGFEQIGRSRLTNDALVATSAARQGLTVLTLNAGDYARIAEFRPFDWERYMP
jgi:predicted nucleic acid-binding protein